MVSYYIYGEIEFKQMEPPTTSMRLTRKNDSAAEILDTAVARTNKTTVLLMKDILFLLFLTSKLFVVMRVELWEDLIDWTNNDRGS
jgi:hypothetical protein